MRPSMIIVALDYGASIGFCAAQLIIKNDQLHLVKLQSDTFWYSSDALKALRSHSTTHAILERCPLNPSTIGRQSYEALYLGLQEYDFDVKSAEHPLILIGPGEWKPFMKKRRRLLELSWHLQTTHTKDAASMLTYWVHTRNPQKEVVYVIEHS